MLIIKVEEQEFYDSRKEMFFNTKPTTVRMEHSLISIAKWESFWEKPYLATPGVTKGISGLKEERYYFKCMIIGDVPHYIPDILLQNYQAEIAVYINKRHSATMVYRKGKSPPSRQIITTELIYYWMIRFGIPLECQRWHFNRLLMLIDVCNIKEQSADKKSGRLSSLEAASYRHELNKARRSG
jgi:hypothetical protein